LRQVNKKPSDVKLLTLSVNDEISREQIKEISSKRIGGGTCS